MKRTLEYEECKEYEECECGECEHKKNKVDSISRPHKREHGKFLQEFYSTMMTLAFNNELDFLRHVLDSIRNIPVRTYSEILSTVERTTVTPTTPVTTTTALITTFIKPNKGLHFFDSVTSLDFSSLYPVIDHPWIDLYWEDQKSRKELEDD